MPQRTDLYTVLNVYARKHSSPLINMETFINFLGKYANKIYEEKPEWTRWTEETGTRVWMDMNRLAEDGRVQIQDNEKGSSVYLSHYYVEQIKETYSNPDKESRMPFPDEHSYNLEIPREQIKILYISGELHPFLEEPQKEILPIIKFVFPDDHGTALVLAPFIPETLMEFSILKIRNYLQHHGNREFIHRKLSIQLAGKDDYLREIFDKIMIRPSDSLNDLKTGREISSFFWVHLCTFIKNDLTQKNELLSEELGALQAIYLIEICSNFYKSKAVKTREIELAYKNFELEMEKPPYYFSNEDIAKFKDNKGVPLLGIYTRDELGAYIEKRTIEQVNSNILPDFLYFYSDDKKAWLIKRTKLLSLCARLLTEVRPVVIKEISKRWAKMLKEYSRESAMDNDQEFEKLAMSYVEENASMLKMILKDKRLYLVHEETRLSEKGIPESSRLFQKNELLAIHVLLLIKRKQLLNDIKNLIPFWYTIPVISNIFNFFNSLKKKKAKKKKKVKVNLEIKERDVSSKEIQKQAAEIAAGLIPAGKNLDGYLEELTSHWGLLVDRRAKQNLVEDVNTLIRDRLRHILRIQKTAAINADTLDKIATSIINNSTGLLKISEQNTLFKYIKLYLAKLLMNRLN